MATVTNLQEPTFRIPGGYGFKVYTYQIGGTTVPISTYSDISGSALNEWPVVLADDGDGNGVAQIYTASDCTVIVKDRTDVTITGWPRDWLRPIIFDELDDLSNEFDSRINNLLSGDEEFTGDIQMGGNKVIGAADGTENADYATVGQVPTIAKPIVSVYTDALQDIPVSTGGTSTKITGFSEIEVNHGTWWSTADNKFTPTIAGWYSIIVGINGSISPNGSYIRGIFEIYKNGSPSRRFCDVTNFDSLLYLNIFASGNVLVYLNGSTDYIEMYITTYGPNLSAGVQVGTGPGTNNGEYTYFQAQLIGS